MPQDTPFKTGTLILQVAWSLVAGGSQLSPFPETTLGPSSYPFSGGYPQLLTRGYGWY